ncbi:Golgi membrane exchange factor (Ric1p-Rgp1p) subunit [Homalodisca vitripennis]|nr:Golgi membrane exchange factor (Ric1p-Rgp1p) subunit [Homalodisca vitripennis]
MSNITARRNPNFYNITNSKGKVARFCLFKQAYKLGEDIIGTFDFSDATVPCVQKVDTIGIQGRPRLPSKGVLKEFCVYGPGARLAVPLENHTTVFQAEIMTIETCMNDICFLGVQ